MQDAGEASLDSVLKLNWTIPLVLSSLLQELPQHGKDNQTILEEQPSASLLSVSSSMGFPDSKKYLVSGQFQSQACGQDDPSSSSSDKSRSAPPPSVVTLKSLVYPEASVAFVTFVQEKRPSRGLCSQFQTGHREVLSPSRQRSRSVPPGLVLLPS